MTSESPSDYERNAIAAIHQWKNPEIGWFGKAMEVINWPLEKMGNVIMNTPGVGWVIEKSVSGLVSVANDLAQWSVQRDAILNEFKKAGHDNVVDFSDVFKLDLEDVDRVCAWLDAKYKGLSLVEGSAFGAMGLPGIPPDIASLITLNLRAIGEYATYYGFDIHSQSERLFAMNILGLASSPNDSAKVVAMGQLVKIAADVARKKAWKDLEKYAFVTVIQHISKALGIRLTKAKLAQTIPVAGAVVGGGFNSYYTAKVCDAAYYLYRERFLAEKHGDDWIEVTVTPPDDYDPNYSEVNETVSGDLSPPPGAIEEKT